MQDGAETANLLFSFSLCVPAPRDDDKALLDAARERAEIVQRYIIVSIMGIS